MSFKENRVRLSVLVQSVLCLGLIFVLYALFFRDKSALSLGDNRHSSANSTKTAIAGTMDALMGPFPTATQPSKTPTLIPTVTPRFSPTPTASSTPTPTKYPRLLSPTPKDRSDRTGVQSQFGGWPLTPTPMLAPLNPQVPPTAITDPPPAATEEPVASEEPTEEPTEPPAEETEPSPPVDLPLPIELPTDLPIVP